MFKIQRLSSVGDFVILKDRYLLSILWRKANESKWTPNIDFKLHTIISKNSDVFLKDNNTGQEYKRYVVHLKKIGDERKIANDNQESHLSDNYVLLLIYTYPEHSTNSIYFSSLQTNKLPFTPFI